LGNKTTTLYDDAGRVTGVQDIRGGLTQYSYD
jgi:YD repeat-containing protein